MVITDIQITEWIGRFLWPLFRVGAMLMVMPVFSARFVPMRVRAAFAMLLTAVISPVLPDVPQVDLLGAEAVLVVLHQMLIGVAMGMVFQIIFTSIAFAGQGIAMSMGLGFASMVDPQNGVQVPVISQFYIIMITLLFLIMDVHLLLFALMVESFHLLPIGIEGISPSNLWALINWAGQAFASALLIALPAIGSLLLVNISFGIITRTAPQLNIFAVGFPIVMVLGYIILNITLPNLPLLFNNMIEGGFDILRSAVLGGTR
jgi:flagellar biosynthetic protein FliR